MLCLYLLPVTINQSMTISLRRINRRLLFSYSTQFNWTELNSSPLSPFLLLSSPSRQQSWFATKEAARWVKRRTSSKGNLCIEEEEFCEKKRFCLFSQNSLTKHSSLSNTLNNTLHNSTSAASVLSQYIQLVSESGEIYLSSVLVSFWFHRAPATWWLLHHKSVLREHCTSKEGEQTRQRNGSFYFKTVPFGPVRFGFSWAVLRRFGASATQQGWFKSSSRHAKASWTKEAKGFLCPLCECVRLG